MRQFAAGGATALLLLSVLQGTAGWGCPGVDPTASCPTFTDQSCSSIFAGTPLLSDSTAAYLASLLAEMAYEPADGSSWEDKAQQLLGSWGSTGAEFISERRGDAVDTQVVVADAPAAVFVFFRGTEMSRSQDLATNLNTALAPMEGLGQVHAGFAEAEEAVHAQISALLDTFRAGTKPVVYAGHSLGAALAHIAAARQELAAEGSVGAVYSFGGPRVGDATWAAAYTALGLDEITYRYVRGRDPVPLIPPGGTIGFFHVGRQVYVEPSACQGDSQPQFYCSVEGAPDSAVAYACSSPSWLVDGLADAAGLVFAGSTAQLSIDDIKSNEPGICCSAMEDHGIQGYVASLNSTCMDACDQLQLCLCQTFFTQPVAANDPTFEPGALPSPSSSPGTFQVYDTAVYTLTVTTSCDSQAGSDGTVDVYLQDASGRKTDEWNLNNWGNDFEACDSDTYPVGSSAWVDPGSWTLHVVFDGGLLGDAWKPETIEVSTSNGPAGSFCLVGGDPDPGWLEAAGDYEFTPCA